MIWLERWVRLSVLVSLFVGFLAVAPAPTSAATIVAAPLAAAQADLQVSVTPANTTVVVPSETIQYNITVTNNGPSAAENVEVILNFTNASFSGNIVGGSTPAGWSCATAASLRERSCERSAPLPAGASETLTVLVDPLAIGVYAGGYVQVSVASISEDPNTSNNTTSPGNVTVTSGINSADMVPEFGSILPSGGIPAGSLMTVVYGARNAGAGATAYTARLKLAAGSTPLGQYEYAYSNCIGTPTEFSCDRTNEVLPNLVANSTEPLYGLVLAPLTPGNYQHRVEADGVVSDPFPGNNARDVPFTVTNPGNDVADLELVSAETAPVPVNPGSTVFYTVTVRNNGPANARNVVVWVPTFPGSNAELGGASTIGAGPLAPDAWDCKPYTWGRGFYCTIPELKDNETAELLFRLSAPLEANIYQDRPGIGSQTGDFNTQNNRNTATLEVRKKSEPTANMHVTMTRNADQSPLPAGDPIKLTFRTTNAGPDDATPAYVGVFWDYYGDEWTLEGYTPPAGWNCVVRPGYSGGMDCFKDQVASGVSEAWEVQLRAPVVTAFTDMRACVLANTTTRNAASVFLPPTHKWACETVYVTPQVADVQITGRDNPDPVNAGGLLNYTLSIKNNGPDFATTLNSLTMKFAPGVTFQRITGPAGWVPLYSTGDGYVFYYPALNAGETTTATVTVLAPSIIGSIVTTATIRGAEFDPNLANNTLTLRTRVSLNENAADLGIRLDGTGSLCVGETASYTATVTNLGPDVAENAKVVFTPPPGLTFVSATSPTFTCTIQPDGSVICTQTSMGVGSGTITLQATGTAAGSGNLVASVSSDTADDNTDDNATQLPVVVKPCQQPDNGRIAYVYNGTAPDALAYESLLEGRGYTVDLIGLRDLTTTDLRVYDLFILADDSGRYPGDGEWFTWGTSQAETVTQMAPIIAANKPVIGLGEGGSIYLEKRGLSIGWLRAWYRTGDLDLERPTPLLAGAIYAAPNAIPTDPVAVYLRNSASLNVFGPRMSAAAFTIGTEIPDRQHFSITGEACHFGWGFRNSPTDMTADGKNLFHNLVSYAIRFQCQPPPPPRDCLELEKSADPINGSEIPITQVGSFGLITYTLRYRVSADPACNNGNELRLVDVLPPDTDFLPGSASDGIAPSPSRELSWPLTPGSSGTKQFTVMVLDSACTAPDTIHNRARIVRSGSPPFESNEVKHLAKCPPIVGDNNNPSFAQDELQIHPYPVITGREHTVSVRLINRTASNQSATVRFQTSSQVFGIGIPFTTFATRVVTIPANGNIIVRVPATFAASGHFCLQVEIDIPGYGVVRSQRNLDVMEDLRPGVPDTLPFKVGNPLPVNADIELVVDNTCPGFTTTVSPSRLNGMAPGEVRNAQLTTTPPAGVVLGSGCHIDVKGFAVIGERRIPLGSGIRKLDVPPIPVTPPSGSLPWDSPYISFQREPLRAGEPNQICIELQNPLGVAKEVTLVYKVANFGAGIGFTEVGRRTVVLPTNSIGKYCIDWTPDGPGHRCILVDVEIPGYRPVSAQKNVDVVRGGWRIDRTIPFTIRNADLLRQPLNFDLQMWGIDPRLVEAVIRVPRPGGGGDPAPNEIAAGQTLQLELAFRPRAVLLQNFTAQAATFGDVQRVDIGVQIGGKPTSGLSVVFEQAGGRVYVPLIRR
jgi:uncharacterized repeat protein (TIGR01451 family)